MKQLKILSLYKPCGEQYRLSGFGNALIAGGHDFRFWRPDEKPAFDAFAEYEPDIFIGTTFDLSRAIEKCVRNRPQMKVILKAGNWGEPIDEKRYPVVCVTDAEKKQLEKLKAETGKPDFVFCHYHPNRLEETMAGWRQIGIEPVALMNAADVVDCGLGTPRPEFVSDISFVGGYWVYKAQNLNKYILPLCATGKYNIKIWGNQPWPVGQYLGYVENSSVADIIRSTRICLSVSEPHSNVYGFDVIERPFKIASAGGFCISDYVASLAEDVFTNGEMDFFDSYPEMVELIDYYLANPDERAAKADRQRRTVFNGHTYFHRMTTMLGKLGFETEAFKLMETCFEKHIPKEFLMTTEEINAASLCCK